jgi:hypothetical protein
MALDDVVIRAMSKQPGDRQPSAGDVGRAALAALSGERPTLPERTVATGAAATKETPQPEPPTIAPEPPTIRLPDRPPSRGRMGARRRLGLTAAGLATLAAVVVAIVALAGGGGSGDGGPALTKAQLVAKADAICADSQDRYRAVRDLGREHSADVSYAEALVRIAKPRIQGLQSLTPPPPIAGAYKEYVEAQKRVYATDRQALAAAREGNAAGVEAARDRRDAEDRLRERLAREIGFAVCSTSKE